jgi:hypothetical protein
VTPILNLLTIAVSGHRFLSTVLPVSLIQGKLLTNTRIDNSEIQLGHVDLSAKCPLYSGFVVSSALPPAHVFISPSTNSLCSLSGRLIDLLVLQNNPITMSDKEFSYQEVSAHNTKKDLYLVIHDKVYNVSSFVDEHPYVFSLPPSGTKYYPTSRITLWFDDIADAGSRLQWW